MVVNEQQMKEYMEFYQGVKSPFGPGKPPPKKEEKPKPKKK